LREHLAPPGGYQRQQTLRGPRRVRQRVQRRDADERLPQRHGQGLQRREAGAQAREAPRPVGRCEQLDIFEPDTRLCERAVNVFEDARGGQTLARLALAQRERPPAARDRSAPHLRRPLHAQSQEAATRTRVARDRRALFAHRVFKKAVV